MMAFYNFLSSYEALIYVVLAIGGLFAFRWLWRSWREMQSAVYRMEREFSMQRLAQSVAVSVFIVILFCAELYVTSFILPNLPSSKLYPTPTLDFISTPTGTLSPEIMTQFANLPRRIPTNSEGCAPGQVMISSPEAGEGIKGSVELLGFANIPNFGFYKLEVAPQGGSTWTVFAAGSSVVKNDTLGKWDTTAVTPGDYQLRLVVTDNQGAASPPCVVAVRVLPLQ